MDTKYLKSSGFTLIEMLVVISIIGLLSSIIFSVTHVAAGKARDARRIADAKSLMTALALYKDKFNKYPCHYPYSNSFSAPDFLQPLITSQFIVKVPKDPTNTLTYSYWYQTFSANGLCGQGADLEITFEYPVTGCPMSGVLVYSTHCHIFLDPPKCPHNTDDELYVCPQDDTISDFSPW